MRTPHSVPTLSFVPWACSSHPCHKNSWHLIIFIITTHDDTSDEGMECWLAVSQQSCRTSRGGRGCAR